MGGSSKSADPVVVGYWYSGGFHYIPCYGPVDAITEVRVADRTAWSGNYTASGYIGINKPELFGGESREGGIDGTLMVKMGEPTQTNSGFGGGGLKPAYRGLLSLLYRGKFAAMNPYMKPWAFKLKRILKGWHNDSVWYSAKAGITAGGLTQMNPAHILYECITNPEWGMGYPTSKIDDASFQAAADTLYAEGFGLFIQYSQQGPVKDFMREIEDHINGKVRPDPATGKFVLKLIRGDYVVDDLDVYDESKIINVDEYQRAGWGETVNEITVKYVDQTNGKVSAVTVHALDNINNQGVVVSRTNDYPGITTFALAQSVAARDLKVVSSPLARVRMRVNRNAWSLLPGDVFVMNFDKHGIQSVVMRVIDCNIGTLDSNEVTISCMEDIFSLPEAVYVGQEPIGWEDPSSEPADSPLVYATEATYYTIARRMSRADLAYLTDDDCYLSVLSKKPSDDAFSYELWVNSGSGYSKQGNGAHCPVVYLSASIGKTETEISYNPDNTSNFGAAKVDRYAYITDGGTGKAELIYVTNIDTTNSKLTVIRGILDTVPAEYVAGTAILWAQGFESSDGALYVYGVGTNFKILTKTGLGTLPIDSATEYAVTMDQRAARPYAPGKLELQGAGGISAYTYEYIEGPLSIAWAHRDRTQQTAGTMISQTDDSIGPEAGVTYTVRIYDYDGDMVHQEVGITGTGYNYPKATEESESDDGQYNNMLRIEVWAVRDGIYSWQCNGHTVDRAGYGLNYGKYYGAGT